MRVFNTSPRYFHLLKAWGYPTLAVHTSCCEIRSNSFLNIRTSEEKAPRVDLRTTGGGRSAPPHNFIRKYPDDILTKAQSKHDVGLNPHIIAPDPYVTTAVYIDVFGPDYKDLLTPSQQPNTMSTGDDDSSSGINGRLRPRKSCVSSPQTNKATRKLDSKPSQEKSKRITTPSKALLTKPDDLSKKSDCSIVEYLCPYCDKIFVSKQTASKHARRIHFSTSKQDTFINCLYCNHTEPEPNDIFKHMIDSHPNQYFACLDCHTRFPSTKQLAEHKLNVCDRQKLPYRSKLRQKSSRTSKKPHKIDREVVIHDEERHGYNSIVISCELKPTHVSDAADIEDNIPTNLILPSNKNLAHKVIDKNAVILLDDLQWTKRIPHNFSFHNSDADQILSRLGVVHRSPRTGESTRKEWFKAIDDANQKFERCFDTSFYSKVASNVQENLAKFLDGTFNFNPDSNHTIKTRKAKNSVPINTVEGFPILLSSEQYSRNLFDGYMPRAIAPKHKWKWDNLENEKNPFNADQIKRDSHVNNCIVTLVSSLDIWTQLCMRKKFEEKFKTTPLEKKTEKIKIIGNELKEILESRQLPAPSTHVTRNCVAPSPICQGADFPSSLGLRPTITKYEITPAVLSGEWVRPRCYVCCACGAQTRDPRALSSHISTQHPNAQVQHYEIPGELLMNADILKHLYVPPSPVHNRTRPPRGFRECTKCNKSITIEDLHQHMLDCAGDMPTVRRKCRYRQFGVRKRRARIQDSRMRKKLRKDIHRQNGRPRPKIRTEVGDGETIRKMLADLPAKRHRVMITPLNSSLRPKRKIVKQRAQHNIKKRPTDELKSRKVNMGSVSESNDNSNIGESNISNDPQDESTSNVKRIQNKLTTRNTLLNNKNVKKKRRRAVQLKEDSQSVDADDQPLQESDKIQTDELSMENRPSRINLNTGPNNAREQANASNNDGSNNRDNRQPGQNENNNGNSRDQGPPPQNVPLKHSIARLTADYDTQDKAVQFHHLFLVQQECNNVTQHVPSDRRDLFENKAVAAKLDKPPLAHHQKDEASDSHNSQKNNKLNKNRKGLNDCIAMLRNKLVEPTPKAPDVSIQCTIDETIPTTNEVKPITTVSRIDITVQCPDDSQPMNTLVAPRVKQAKILKLNEELCPNLPSTSEDKNEKHELKPQHKNTVSEKISNPELEKTIKVVDSKITQGLNVEKLIQNQQQVNLLHRPHTNIGDSVTKNYENMHNHCTPDAVNFIKTDITKSTKEVGSNSAGTSDIKALIHSSNTSKQAISTAPMSTSTIPNIREPETNLKTLRSHVQSHEKKGIEPKEQSLEFPAPLVKLKDFEYKEENVIKNKMYSANEIPLAHSNSGVESILTVPLDLSGKLYANKVTAHCSKQDTSFGVKTCEAYETLDLSNKTISKQDNVAPMVQIEDDDVVDLRVKHIISTQSADSSIYSDENIAVTATDLSVRNTETNCLPTDLSIKRNLKAPSLYSNVLHKQRVKEIHPLGLINTDKDIVCLNLSAKEVPTDLSKKTLPIPTSNIKSIEKGYFHSPPTESEKIKIVSAADLSHRYRSKHIISDMDNVRTNQSAQCNTSLASLKSFQKTHSTEENESNESISLRKLQSGTEPMRRSSSSDVTISFINRQNPTHSTNSEIRIQQNSEKSSISLDEVANTPNVASKSPKSGVINISSMAQMQPQTTKSLSPDSFISPIKLISHSTPIMNTVNVSTPELNIPNTTSNYAHITGNDNATHKLLHQVKDSQNIYEEQLKISKSRRSQSIYQERYSDFDDKVLKSCIEQDPETAKKIAMLPKELVEILGNMPLDHRNQLLNVLPQYVSVSTTTTPKTLDATVTLSSTNEDSKYNIDRHEYFIQKETNSSRVSSYTGVSVTEQLTADKCEIPHTLATNYSHTNINPNKTPSGQFSGNTDIPSTREQTHSNDLNNYRVIDLTDDTVDIKNVIACPDKEKTSIAKVIGQKSNEKTASLRAVRIKAPSERQKSIITEPHFKKPYPENNNIISLKNLDIKKDVVPLAVQQFEITTTDEAKVVNFSSKSSTVSPDSSFSNSTSNVTTATSTPPCVVSENNEIVKENITISSSQIDTASSACDIALHLPCEPVGETHSLTCRVMDKGKSEIDITEINVAKSTPDLEKCPQKDDEDDSEDDVSLAIIVKQKQKEQMKTPVSAVSPTQISAVKDVKENIHADASFENISNIDLLKPLDKNNFQSADIIKNDPNLSHRFNVADEVKYKHTKKIKKPSLTVSIPATHVVEKLIESEFEGNKENTAVTESNCSKIEENLVEKSLEIEEKNNSHLESTDENKKASITENNQLNEHVSESNIQSKTIFEQKHEQDSNNVIARSYNDTPIHKIDAILTYGLSTKTQESKPDVIVSNNILPPKIKNATSSETEQKLNVVLNKDTIKNSNEAQPSQNDSFITPLRRSRRGKSLYIESSELSYDNKNCLDPGAEHRFPFTKKQLIFSKLLQDEENIVTQTETSQNDEFKEQSQGSLHENITHMCDNISSNKLIDKRKHSPHTKRKLKKKKAMIEELCLQKDDLKELSTETNNHSSFVSSEGEISCETNENKYKSTPVLKVKELALPSPSSEDKRLDLLDSHKNHKIRSKRKSYSFNVKDEVSYDKSKKIKTSIENETDLKSNSNVERNNISEEVNIPEVKCKAAARRGRSKSVFVKSSAPISYDPYDIDLDEVVQGNETNLKKQSFFRPLLRKNLNKSLSTNAPKDKDVKNVPSTSDSSYCDFKKDKEEKVVTLQIESIVETKGFVSDSDESAKSDEPLKKYVEEKEKKKSDIKYREKGVEESKISRKKHKKTVSEKPDKSHTNVGCEDTEEQIRSEQFMESFGFFSERKPRKSNLLATKKISETFHIIANESDDSFFKSKEKSSKKGLHENRKLADDEGNSKEYYAHKKNSKRGRKKKISPKIESSFCGVCKKDFRRPDNLLRHQMGLAHATRVSEVELKVKTAPLSDEDSNYLVIYKQQIDRLRYLQDTINRRKKYCKSVEKIALPTLEEVITDVTRTVRQQQVARRGLSRDEALFLDCCELLNASHKDDGSGRAKDTSNISCYSCAQTSAECLNSLEKRINEHLDEKCDDGDVDSITAQDILESEEVRNLENDLISGLKEAACANSFNGNKINPIFTQDVDVKTKEDIDNVIIAKDSETESQFRESKSKKALEIKEKMYPDIIEDIDMFEDKFDKIKRKCRSQAAKQTQYVETSISLKSRKKVEKQKRRKSPKKNSHSAVPTKAALKGFEGVKVSILTSEINMSSILPPSSTPLKKKKRSNSKRKRERKHHGDTKYDPDHKSKELQKKVDVYEFMDNDDAELFEFRPSTLMERFKSISNKDAPSTSKSQPDIDPDLSSESASDGDDFVYMSDDYVCSDAETENSLLSCETGNNKSLPEVRKPVTPPKKRDTTEKSAVMGKIFKHNAVRTEKKPTKAKEPVRPKANLDQLFDSLLEEEPSSSILAKSSLSPKRGDYDLYNIESPLTQNDTQSEANKSNRDLEEDLDDSEAEPPRKYTRSPSPIPYTGLILHSKKRKSSTSPRKKRLSFEEEDNYSVKLSPSTSKTPDDTNASSSVDNRKMDLKHTSHKKKKYANINDSTSKRRNTYSPNYDDDSLLRVDNATPTDEDYLTYKKRKHKDKVLHNKSPKMSHKTLTNSYDNNDRFLDDSEAGVATQRARRKCTVGKQNVLAETWSSESEPDGIPRRPNSVDSVVAGLSRKKKSRKRDNHTPGSRKSTARPALFPKRGEIGGSCRNSSEVISRVVPTTRPSAVGPSSSKVRPRPPPYYWSDEEEEQEHVQQHGWIVGDSHKKLVTMLAHAKGKRNNDDKRHFVD
ncbi:unnamed protein product [Leptosia nina]|uniref:C2H2-type domain-containing protein n=1 Tax=Leptosia nina TaxID=320188 RepID=A0AAV1K240_9NEOP